MKTTEQWYKHLTTGRTLITDEELTNPPWVKVFKNESEAAPQTCQWEPNFDDDGIHSTACGNKHVFIAGDMAANHYKYCPYCGLAIEES